MFAIFKDIEKRNFGLDLFRVIAISTVIFGHGFSFLGFEKYNKFIPIDGVDLFFVLSGFLIGRILLKINSSTLHTVFSESLIFLKRRWFRTLPNYFLFLAINIILVFAGVYDGLLNINTLAYFGFLQNLFKPLDLMFWESWSLAVEEWFYLLFPVFLIVLYSLKKLFKATFSSYLAICTILILTPLLLRIIFTHGLSADVNTDLYLRKIVIYRLDTIAYGLITAYLFKNYSSFIAKHKIILFLLGILGFSILRFMPTESFTFFRNTFSYSLEAIFIACLIPVFYYLSKPREIFNKPVVLISLISYSMYLVHLPILYLLRNFIPQRTFVAGNVAIMMLYLALTILISAVVYYFWEKPMMNLRDRK